MIGKLGSGFIDILIRLMIVFLLASFAAPIALSIVGTRAHETLIEYDLYGDERLGKYDIHISRDENSTTCSEYSRPHSELLSASQRTVLYEAEYLSESKMVRAIISSADQDIPPLNIIPESEMRDTIFAHFEECKTVLNSTANN